MDLVAISPKMELCTLQTVPFSGSLPSRKYSRIAFAVHDDTADNEQCCKSLLSSLPEF